MNIRHFVHNLFPIATKNVEHYFRFRPLHRRRRLSTMFPNLICLRQSLRDVVASFYIISFEAKECVAHSISVDIPTSL